ncbi:hypothetical protein [Algoriphagus formosus]|uniref:Uncharacterized protein n=1 Tax=Algoriphagus formosus TaxID=2007308 RepID=A0A4R5VD97_9BACT|nr:MULTISPECIES: hypothetical protein [Algoriphagus]TDK50274.1 hypothetical protein E1898_01585 [Algoriphagus aquimaris]
MKCYFTGPFGLPLNSSSGALDIYGSRKISNPKIQMTVKHNSSNSKLTELKLFLRVFAWFIVLTSLAGMLVNGYVGINRGFDWSYLKDYRTYINLIFNMILWSVVMYFTFWKYNPNYRKKMQEKYGAKK